MPVNASDDTPIRRVRLHIRGQVQGVWFRAWTVREARARGLRGWVRNRRDGGVEVLVIGPPDRVRDMVAACREGPPMARVEAVEECDLGKERLGEDDGSIGFQQRPTA